MKSVYIYPTYRPDKDATGNKYIEYFHDAFRHRFYVRELLSQFGIISLFFNIKSDLFIFHWVETIRFKRFGLVQVFVFVVGVSLLKIFEKKIIWVLHNKRSHKGDSKVAFFCMKFMARSADIIVTHATEGLRFIEEKFGEQVRRRAFLIPHPVYSQEIFSEGQIEWDIIIWGSIERYKNIVPFLEFVKGNKVMQTKRILICGRCKDITYLEEIYSILLDNITLVNEFLEEDILRRYISKSKVILFTYSLDSVLSSGALIYSLNFGKKIIGPNGGAFKDMHPIVDCYDSFENIADIIDIDKKVDISIVKEYINNNTWCDLPEKLLSELFM